MPLLGPFLSLSLFPKVEWQAYDVPCSSYAYPSAPDQRLVVFIDKAKASYRSGKSIDHVDSPFLPYLGRLFEKGLNKKQRLEFEKAQDSGDIITITDLLEAGFRQPYPFLEPAFKNPDTYRITGYYFNSPDLSGNKLTGINALLKELFSRWPRKNFKPVNVAFFISRKYALRQYEEIPSGEDQLSTVLFGLGELAFCDDYPPAIRKLLKTMDRSGGMILRKADRVFLIARARIHGLDGLELDQKTQSVAASMDEKRFLKLQAAARVPHITEMESRFGFWPKVCLEAEKARWNKTHQ